MDIFSEIQTKIFADCADLNEIEQLNAREWVKGFTTNPTLMRQNGVTDYKAFAMQALNIVKDLPISFEVFADELDEMEAQANEICSWGKNIYIKIPVMNTKRESTAPLIARLSKKGVPVNVTAVFTIEQVKILLAVLDKETPAVISIFAGRIADTGRNPEQVMSTALELIKNRSNIELLWASPRELLNLFQANRLGCHIITMSYGLLKKIPLIGKDLEEFSLETVKMFYDDAVASKFSINCDASQPL